MECNHGMEARAQIDTKQPLSRNNPHYAILSKAPVYNYGWDGIEIKRELNIRYLFMPEILMLIVSVRNSV